jgi:parallel beta-helix repeat protein
MQPRIPLFLVASFAFASQVSSQGNLTPPGAPSPSMKSLDQLELGRMPIDSVHTPGNSTNNFIVNQPGSYYLTADVTGVSGKNGIMINSDNVTIDLRGFSLLGATGTLTGILNGGTFRNITVQHGAVRNWDTAGINLNSGFVNSLLDLHVTTNGTATGGYGIAGGTDCLIADCVSRANFDANITALGNANIIRCLASVSSTGRGISTLSAATVQDCTTHDNAQENIFVDGGSTVTNCTANSSAGRDGINAFASVVSHCIATSNNQNGINVTQGTVEGCTANSNGQSGIVLNGGSVVFSTAQGNGADGIDVTALFSQRVSGCTALSNSQSGIHLSGSGVVEECQCDFNLINGILVDSNGAGTIRNNSCNENGSSNQIVGNAIWIKGSGSVVEKNHVAHSLVGINLTGGTKNVVIGNTAGSNQTNYSIPGGFADNAYGPIVDVSGGGDLSTIANGNAANSNLSQ